MCFHSAVRGLEEGDVALVLPQGRLVVAQEHVAVGVAPDVEVVLLGGLLVGEVGDEGRQGEGPTGGLEPARRQLAAAVEDLGGGAAVLLGARQLAPCGLLSLQGDHQGPIRFQGPPGPLSGPVGLLGPLRGSTGLFGLAGLQGGSTRLYGGLGLAHATLKLRNLSRKPAIVVFF